jgi:hypothetical protein
MRLQDTQGGSPLRGVSDLLDRVRGGYRGLARGDRTALYDLLDTRQALAYEGDRTVLYAVFALLDWIDTLDELTVEVDEEASGPDRLLVTLRVRGRRADLQHEIPFRVAHVWTVGADGRARFQWFDSSGDAPFLDTESGTDARPPAPE